MSDLDVPIHLLDQIGQLSISSRRCLAMVDTILLRDDLPEEESRRWLELRAELSTLVMICDLHTLPYGQLADVIPEIVIVLNDAERLFAEVRTALESHSESHPD